MTFPKAHLHKKIVINDFYWNSDFNSICFRSIWKKKLPFELNWILACVGSNGVSVIVGLTLEFDWLELLLLANISFSSSMVLFLLVPFWLDTTDAVEFGVEIRHEFVVLGLLFTISCWYFSNTSVTKSLASKASSGEKQQTILVTIQNFDKNLRKCKCK